MRLGTVRKPLIVSLILVNLVFLAVIAWLAPKALRVRTLPQTQQGLPVVSSVRTFELTRENGELFSSKSLEGHPWLASFIFTRCAGACPMMSGRFAVLQDSLPASFRLVSFSVDPSYDTPAVLKDYSQKFYARPDRWAFLTGEKAVIDAVRTDLKLSADEDPAMHSLRFVLIDGRGGVRGYYDWQDPVSLEKLSKDAKTLGET